MARLAIAGYPNAGKSSLFNALTGLDVPVAAHPYSTTEAHQGVAAVPDPRLEAAAEAEGSDRLVLATLDLLDLPVSPGAAFSGELLGRLRDMDAVVFVLRSFDDEAIPDEGHGTDPVPQAENLLLEMALADAEVLARRAERAHKEATADASLRRMADTVAAAAAMTGDGRALRERTWDATQLEVFSDLAPLTMKPAVWVINVAEGFEGDYAQAVQSVVPEGDTVVTLSAKLEAEAAQLDPAERAELFEGLGLGEGALATVVNAAYTALDLISFYTVGPKESRAWTVRRGSAVRTAAGKIHSDLERGFIRAEVIHIDDVVAHGGFDAAKAAGAARLEGKDYVVAEGDTILVRFSV